MAFSKVTYVASGATDLFSVPFEFLSREHVTVSVNTVDSSFTWESDGQIRLDTTPTNGDIVQVKRNTPKTNPMVDWQNGANIDEPNLDLSTKQSLYITQEAIDETQSAILEDSDGVFDAKNTRIKNLADGIEDTDAVTVGQINTFVTQAEGYASDSLASSLIAEGHADDAEQSAADALALEASTSTLRDEAEGFRNEAEGFANDAQNSVGGVKVSANDTTAGTLDSKVAVSGGGIISVTGEGENETLVINLPDKSSQPQAVAGTDDNSYMTPLKTKQAIESLASTDNASTATKGVVQKATVAQIKAETATGSTGAELFVTPEDMVQHHGVAKAHVTFDGTGTVSIFESFNHSSVTDSGNGIYRPNMTVTMNSATYNVQASYKAYSTTSGYTPSIDVIDADTYEVRTGRLISSGNFNYQYIDSPFVACTVHGELA